jgi:hypothetical protein
MDLGKWFAGDYRIAGAPAGDGGVERPPADHPEEDA